MTRAAFATWGIVTSLVALAACGPTPHPGDDDGMPDAPPPDPMCSVDTDGDTIADCHDGTQDTDSDGTPDLMDQDSDGDGITDAVEAGDSDLATPPQNSDNDGAPDFQDIDADNDGLQDAEETIHGTDPTNPDTDGDGFSDLVEVTIHILCQMNPSECNGDPDPLDPNVGVSPDDFFFILPYQDPEQMKPLDFSTDIQVADVHFSMDTTGSMGSEINALATSLSSIITQITDPVNGVPNTAVGVSSYDDFPLSPWGTAAFGDRVHRMFQRVTSVPAEAQAGVNMLQTVGAGGGNDTPESGWEALYQIATGVGNAQGLADPFVATNGYDPAKHGLLGGVGFRAGAVPIVVQITDAVSHDGEATSQVCSPYVMQYTGVTAASRTQAMNALVGLGARVIGIASTEFAPGAQCNPRVDLELAATTTSARVPPVAFDLGGRPPGCAANQCCTGINGAGRATDGAGLCPLVYDVTAAGAGVGTSIVNAIKMLVNFAVIDVSTRKVSMLQPNAFGGLTDPALFITDIIPIALNPNPPGGMVLDPTGRIILDVQPGTTATFDVKARNDFLMEADNPQVFTLKIDVVGDGITTLDTRQVVIIVPASSTIID
jgi:hypothetical protein